MRPKRCYRVESGQLVRVMKQLPQRLARRQRLVRLHVLAQHQHQHQQAMLGDGQRQLPTRVPAPAAGAGQADCYIAVLQLIGLRVEEVEPPAGAEPHPGAIGLHAPLPFLCLMTSFQSTCPPGGTSRSERTPAAFAISARCAA